MRVTGRLLSTVAVAAGLTAALVGAGLAQEATPTAMEDDAYAPYLSHLHAGSCGDLSAEPVERLANLELPEWVGALAGGAEIPAETTAIDVEDFGNAPVPVAVSTTEVPIPLADIIAGGHAISVEVSDPADPEDDVACGNIGGIPDDDGNLFVGLEEEGGSGHHGVAWLLDTGSSTTITVFLAHPEVMALIEAGLAGMATAATPMATPMAGAEETPMATPEAGAATPTT